MDLFPLPTIWRKIMLAAEECIPELLNSKTLHGLTGTRACMLKFLKEKKNNPEKIVGLRENQTEMKDKTPQKGRIKF